VSSTQVKIIMKAPGMTPEEVESRIALPIEVEMLGIPKQRMLRSVSKYGIVDVDATKCIGCGYCATGCPFDVPKFHAKTGKMAKCTLCIDRVEVGLEPACIKACPTGCLNFGTKESMVALGNERVTQLKAQGFSEAMLYNPEGVGGTGVVTVLGHGHPDWYDLPVDPHVPFGVRLWKQIVRPLGVLAAFVAVLGSFVHYTTYGPKVPPDGDV